MFWQVSSSGEVLYLTSALQTKPGFISSTWIIRTYNKQKFCYNIYSQTCIKRTPLEQRKSCLIWQLTSYKRFNSYDIFYDRTRKGWPFNRGDCMGRFDCIWKRKKTRGSPEPALLISSIFNDYLCKLCFNQVRILFKGFL